jgi:hypothetical protein
LTELRPHELRELLEQEVRAAWEETRSKGYSMDPTLLIGAVLERHQHKEEVKQRLEFLWAHLEAYVGSLRDAQ